MIALLARHGESEWNAQGRYQGRRDAPISERGRHQARVLAEHLGRNADQRPRAIVSSPLSRALDTAHAVASQLQLAVDVDERLIEICHGDWEGRLAADVERRWPELLREWRTSPHGVRFPNGESLADVRARWRSFVPTVGRWSQPLLIVTHDVIVRLAVLDGLGRGLEAFNAVSSENASLTELSIEGDAIRLRSGPDATYLKALRTDTSTQAL